VNYWYESTRGVLYVTDDERKMKFGEYSPLEVYDRQIAAFKNKFYEPMMIAIQSESDEWKNMIGLKKPDMSGAPKREEAGNATPNSKDAQQADADTGQFKIFETILKANTRLLGKLLPIDSVKIAEAMERGSRQEVQGENVPQLKLAKPPLYHAWRCTYAALRPHSCPCADLRFGVPYPDLRGPRVPQGYVYLLACELL
jgi:hypothetical protein